MKTELLMISMMMMMMMMMMMVMMMVMMMMASPWLETILVVASGHRETPALKLIVTYVAEIQN